MVKPSEKRKNVHLRSDFKQMEQYNEYLANECRKKLFVIYRQKISLGNEKAKTKTTENGLFQIGNKNIINHPATLYEFLLVKNSA